jgi:hypothetical protein
METSTINESDQEHTFTDEESSNIIPEKVIHCNINNVIDELDKCKQKMYAFLKEYNDDGEFTCKYIQNCWLNFRQTEECNDYLNKYIIENNPSFIMKPLTQQSENIDIYDNSFMYHKYDNELPSLFIKFIKNLPKDLNDSYILTFITSDGTELWIRRNKPNDPSYENGYLFSCLIVYLKERNINRNIIPKFRQIYNKLNDNDSKNALKLIKLIPEVNFIMNDYTSLVVDIRIYYTSHEKEVNKFKNLIEYIPQDINNIILDYLINLEYSDPILYYGLKEIKNIKSCNDCIVCHSNIDKKCLNNFVIKCSICKIPTECAIENGELIRFECKICDNSYMTHFECNSNIFLLQNKEDNKVNNTISLCKLVQIKSVTEKFEKLSNYDFVDIVYDEIQKVFIANFNIKTYKQYCYNPKLFNLKYAIKSTFYCFKCKDNFSIF